MAKRDVQKFRVLGLRKHKHVLLSELQKKGGVQVEFEENALGSEESRLRVARLEFLREFVGEVPASLQVPVAEAESRAKAFFDILPSVAQRAEAVEENEVVLRLQGEKVSQWQKEFEPFASLRGTVAPQGVVVRLVGFVVGAFEEIEAGLSSVSQLVEVQKVGGVGAKTAVDVWVHESVQELVVAELAQFGFVSYSIPEEALAAGIDSFEAYSAYLEDKVAELEALGGGIVSEREAIVGYGEEIAIASDVAAWQQGRQKVSEGVFGAEYVFGFTGWIDAEFFDDFSGWVAKSFAGEVDVEAVPLLEGEVVPALLKNNQYIRPFEMLTDMYGVPVSDDIDPTPSLSPFFLVFFGICLSDVGYGALLVLAGVWFSLKSVTQESKDMFRMITMCGVSAIIGGVLLGGWFGITTEQAPSLLLNAEGGFRGAILDPLAGSGPLDFLVFSLAVGVVQLLSGVLVEFYKHIKNGNYVAAFADSLAWFVFLVCLILFAMADMVGIPGDVAKWMAIGSAGILVLTQGRDEEVWVLKPIMGLLGLYGVMNYLSDILSYSRLMALGLATGVIGFAMNTTAVVLFDMVGVPVVSHLVAAVVLVFGHGLNFGLSMLGASIHSMRLQFIEFFGRFYKGGGKSFRPFARKTRFISLRS